MAGMITCPTCGKLTDPRLDNCPHCGIRMQVGAGAASRSRDANTRETCPNCSAFVQEGDIICVACGTNLLTGQKIVHERPAGERRARRRVSPMALLLGAVVLLIVLVAVLAVIFIRLKESSATQLKAPRPRSEMKVAAPVPSAARWQAFGGSLHG